MKFIYTERVVQLQSGYRERPVEVLSSFLADSTIRKQIVIFRGDFGIAITFQKSWLAASGDIRSELLIGWSSG